jgi:hypothetical protein
MTSSSLLHSFQENDRGHTRQLGGITCSSLNKAGVMMMLIDTSRHLIG